MAIHPSSTIVTPDVETSHGHGRARNTAVWLASYALGLASSDRRAAACIDEIIDAADSDVDRLVHARRHLLDVAVVDEDLRARAYALLTVAAAGVEVGLIELNGG